MAIIHGQDTVTDVIESSKFDYEPKDTRYFFDLDQTLYFTMNIKNMHRCAKLCLSLNYISKRKKVKLMQKITC